MRIPNMEPGSKEHGVRIKVEPGTKISSTSGAMSKFAPISVRKDLGGRLASFKPPRDLSLTGSSSHIASLKLMNSQAPGKKVFQPNVNVTRRKGPSITALKESSGSSENKPSTEHTRKSGRSRGNFVQTQGVFSEGLAPGKPREYNRGHEAPPTPQLEKPKLNLNRAYDKKKEESHIKDLLKDDFIDDPRMMPDVSDCPKSLPLLINAKPRSFQTLDQTFESLQVKVEKSERHDSKDLETSNRDMAQFFLESSATPRLVVFDFPDEVKRPEPKKSAQEIKREQNSKTEATPAKTSSHRLGSVGEGLWGTLRVLEDGTAYILVGREKIPVTMTRNCPRQEVMSVGVDTAASRGEIINLGAVCANFKCSTDLSFLDRGS